MARSLAEWIEARRQVAESVNWSNWRADGADVLASDGWWTTLLCRVPAGRLGDFTTEAASGIAQYIALNDPTTTLLLDAVVLAAERRRQAMTAWNDCRGPDCRSYYAQFEVAAGRDLDAALDALVAHVMQRGDTPDDGLKADRSRDNAEDES